MAVGVRFHEEEEIGHEEDETPSPVAAGDGGGRSSRRPRRAHLVTEALADNDELHTRLIQLEAQLDQQGQDLQQKWEDHSAEQEAKIVRLEQEVRRLKETYEPQSLNPNTKMRLLQSSAQQMAHDAKMRELLRKLDDSLEENAELRGQLDEAQAKRKEAEERAQQLEQEQGLLKDQVTLKSREVKSLQSSSSELENRLHELEATIRDEREKARLAIDELEQQLADEQVHAADEQVSDRSRRGFGRCRASRRAMNQSGDSLADELSFVSSWRLSVGSKSFPPSEVEEDENEDKDEDDVVDTGKQQALPYASMAQADEDGKSPVVTPSTQSDQQTRDGLLEACPPPPPIRGILQKKSPAAFRQLWPYQRRLCIMEAGRLCWYDHHQENPDFKSCKGSVDFLFNPSAIEEDADSERFVVRPLDGMWMAGSFSGAHAGRVLEFSVRGSEHPRVKWVEAIKRHIDYGLRNRAAMLPHVAAAGRSSLLGCGTLSLAGFLSDTSSALGASQGAALGSLDEELPGERS